MCKKILASGFAPALFSPLNMCSSVSPAGSAPRVPAQSVDFTMWWLHRFLNNFSWLIINNQEFIIGVIIELVCCLRCPVNSFTDVYFIVVFYGENTFWVAGRFFTAVPQVATEKNWLIDRVVTSYPALINRSVRWASVSGRKMKWNASGAEEKFSSRVGQLIKK